MTDVKKCGQVDENPVGLIGIVLTIVYLILLYLLLIYGIVRFWLSDAITPNSSEITFLCLTFTVSDEIRLLIIVILAGALGGLVHAFRSLSWYIGNRKLLRCWLAMYILLPFVGSALALVFYFVIRGGFFSSQSTVQQTSHFGFLALASLVGLFSEQAVVKLKEVAETLLAKPPKGQNHASPVEQANNLEFKEKTF